MPQAWEGEGAGRDKLVPPSPLTFPRPSPSSGRGPLPLPQGERRRIWRACRARPPDGRGTSGWPALFPVGGRHGLASSSCGPDGAEQEGQDVAGRDAHPHPRRANPARLSVPRRLRGRLREAAAACARPRWRGPCPHAGGGGAAHRARLVPPHHLRRRGQRRDSPAHLPDGLGRASAFRRQPRHLPLHRHRAGGRSLGGRRGGGGLRRARALRLVWLGAHPGGIGRRQGAANDGDAAQRQRKDASAQQDPADADRGARHPAGRPGAARFSACDHRHAIFREAAAGVAGGACGQPRPHRAHRHSADGARRLSPHRLCRRGRGRVPPHRQHPGDRGDRAARLGHERRPLRGDGENRRHRGGRPHRGVGARRFHRAVAHLSGPAARACRFGGPPLALRVARRVPPLKPAASCGGAACRRRRPCRPARPRPPPRRRAVPAD
jgi:hypothetical protein